MCASYSKIFSEKLSTNDICDMKNSVYNVIDIEEILGKKGPSCTGMTIMVNHFRTIKYILPKI